MLGSYISPFDSLGWQYSLGTHFATDGAFTYHSDFVFSVVDVRRPDSMYLAGRVPGYFGGPGSWPVLGNGTAYATYGLLFAIDIDDPHNPDVINPLGSTLSFNHALLRDTLLYEGTNLGLRVVNVKDALNISQVGAWTAGGPISWVTMAGAQCVLSRGTNGIVTVDVSKPSAPALREWFDTPGRSDEAYVDDTVLYVGDFYGLEVMRLDITTGIAENDNAQLPLALDLKQNYPNPFNPSTTITFSLNSSSEVSLAVHNVLGQLVALSDMGILAAGHHSITWMAIGRDATPLPSGVYFYRVTAHGHTLTRKMVLLR